MPIHDLATHPAYYVTVTELAEYWAVSRRQIHKRIESGHLYAIRLGARLYRIRTQAALDFERQATPLSRARKTSGSGVLISALPASTGHTVEATPSARTGAQGAGDAD